MSNVKFTQFHADHALTSFSKLYRQLPKLQMQRSVGLANEVFLMLELAKRAAPFSPRKKAMNGFGGSTVEATDAPRLLTQLDAVRQLMSDGLPRTLANIAVRVSEMIGRKATEASVSARLRDLRKVKFGSYTVERIPFGDGLFTYRLNIQKKAA